jgi:predicted RNA binding protein YcfA (HicA-like mRNA interferase family)
MTARQVVREITAAGGVFLRKAKGSHRMYGCDTAKGKCGGCRTVVAMHPGEMPRGTLRSIQQALEKCLGKGWLGVK